ncbi:hypothetical protein SISNIDRAFT_453567 [Sistotremastrum niveocremeum HHB9708]|uniref:Chromo domain-containing protein n=1 Tax=Sistotremastrum niveocremeum HHB9708 TaxID=1314777 RepID=A0A164VZH9_9AGAM|nr:hypothetical protein SISNIDRAFT_453567 [Sistotremastrum niveocremeum HHB9708]
MVSSTKAKEPVVDMEVEEPQEATNGDQSDEGEKEAEENGEQAEEEFEIEEILKHSKGYYEEGIFAYFVKWKGYAEDENTWVNEPDAIGAQDLITEYWEKKGGRPSPTKGRGKATKGRKSGASNASAASVEPSEKASASKRSNQRKRKLSEETEDEAPSASKRKARESTADSVPQAITVDDDDEIGNMQQWMSKKNWESIVKEINTVERDANGELLIYFTLHNGSKVMEPAKLCRTRFPQKMVSFYESHLRWREQDPAP